eukprot:4319732-Pleurochrysis_carterae.AAC.1
MAARFLGAGSIARTFKPIFTQTCCCGSAWCPPCVRTGANFYSSVFCASLLRNHELGTLGKLVYRQTDGGSDNDVIITHVLHLLLVHMGVVERWYGFASNQTMGEARDWARVSISMRHRADPTSSIGKSNWETEFAWNWASFDWVTWAKSFSCVAQDFGYQSKLRYWHYEYDEYLAKHGYVLVRYRRTLLPPKDGEPEFLPADYVGGKWVPKPKGLLFMLNRQFPKVSVAADVESWKPAETDATEGLGVHDKAGQRTAPTASECVQRDQWRALHQFHLQYSTCDSLPPLPISCAAPPTEAKTVLLWNMEHGTSVSWTLSWEKLAWKFSRPHKPQQYSDIPAGSNFECAALYSGVTGINNPMEEVKRKALQTQQRDKRIDASLTHRDSVEVGELFLVGVTDCFEGQLAVGIGRIVAPVSADGEEMVKWLQRVGTSSNPASRGYAWTESPTFVGPQPPCAGEQNLQPLTDVLPCPVSLTKKSEKRYFVDKSLAHRDQQIRLTQESI